MNQTSSGRQQSAFSSWLRTGRLPRVRNPDGVEVKFNPWHDPEDGRFTFAGSGTRSGSGGGRPTAAASGRAPKIGGRDGAAPARVEPRPEAAIPRAERLTSDRRTTGVEPLPKPAAESQSGDRPNPTAEFVGGVGEGLYDAAEGAVTGVYEVLTTNPVTTVRNAGRGVADMIDTAIAAEDVPARVQVARAADAVANASAREIGRATGSVVGNTALAVTPAAAVSKVSTLRHLRKARPRTTYDPPKIGWAKETLKSQANWRFYNDSATGSRPGQAPTLMRTMPDGSKRPVKFDGIQGDYVIDRKWKVVDAPRARAQLLRQSEVLAQHRLIGAWEVPTSTQKVKARKLFKKTNVTNINVKVMKP